MNCEPATTGCCLADVHICGICKQQFSLVENFLQHKAKNKCDDEDGDDLGQTLELNSDFNLVSSEEQQDDQHVSTLRARLLGLAAAAQAELLDTASHETVHSGNTFSSNREEVSRGLKDDEENAADVLANQLSGIGQSHAFSVSINSDVVTEIVHSSQHEEPMCIDDDKKETTRKTTKKSSENKKIKKEKVVVQKSSFKCQEEGCVFEGKYYKDLVRHLRVHTGEKPFECEICSRFFSRADKLKQHLRIHSGDKPFHCEMCSYASVDSTSLRKHLRTHTDERPCKCQLCPYRARDSSQLVVHLRTHTGDVPFICLAPNCTAAFKTSSDLKRHTRLHTDEKPYSCDTCLFRTRMKGNLLAHMRRVHLGGSKTYTCNICNDFKAATHSTLLAHKKSHANRLLRCNVGKCDYVGVNVASMRGHLRSKHPEECPALPCHHCKFTCSTLAEMKSHMKQKHKQIAEEKQKKSSKAAPKASGTSNTDKTTLTFTKTFKCPICFVSFVREDSLRAHMRVHMRACTGQKGVVVIDTLEDNEDADDPPVVEQEKVTEFDVTVEETGEVQASTTQPVVFYMPRFVGNEAHDSLLLSPNTGSNLIEQLSLQQGVQYILVPSSTTESFEHHVTEALQQ